MSANVDERVVQMQFDNQQFEAKAQNTITTLNSLAQALNLPFANTKGLDQVQNSANRLDFSKLSQAIETVQYRFSLLGTMGVEVLNRISTAAVNLGQNLVNSVTMEPIKAGFDEYQLKMDSVKRILNSAKNEDGTAVSLDQVNRKLDELNTYADKTIYSFSDMTQSIGKFTNAGVDLDTAVKAIQGISNEAALAGANTDEASRAMYNFAQALSVGYVKTVDWRSIELANMATTGFKEALVQTAVELETVKKKGDNYVTTTKNMNGKTSEAMNAMTLFSDGLQYQWLTTDVLIQTLSRYSNETDELGKAAFKAATEVTTFSKLIDTLKEALGSGWTETWQLIIGDFNEAKQMWTAVNDVLSNFINTSADARNEVLKLWKAVGGRDALLEALGNVWVALQSAFAPVKKAFDDVLVRYHTLTGQASFLSRITKQFRDFTEGLRLNWFQQKQVELVARGLFSVFDLLGQVVSAVWRTISPVFKVLGDVFDIILQKSAFAGKNFSEFVANLKETDAIYNTLQKLVGVFQKVASTAFNAFKAILDFLGFHVEVEEGAGFIETLSAVFEAFAQNPLISTGIDLLIRAKNAIVEFVTGIQGSEVIQKIAGALSWLGNALATIGGAIKDNVVDLLGQLGAELKEFFTAADGTSLDFGHILDVGVIGMVFKTLYDTLSGKNNPIGILKKFFDDLSNFQDLMKDAAEAFSEFAETITEPLKALTESIKAETLLKIAKAIAILAASLWVLSRIDEERLGVGLFGIAALLGELTAAMAGLTKITSAADTAKLTALGPALIAISVAIGILSLAVRALGGMDDTALINAVIAVGSLMALMAIMTRIGGSNLNTKGMITMSIAIFILQASVKRLGELDETALAHGVEAVGLLLVIMTLLSRFSSKNFSGVGLIMVALAVRILQGVVMTLGSFDEVALNRGVTAVAVLITFLALFSRISGQNALTASIGTIALAFAMGMLQKTIAAFATMDTDALGQGLIATALALGMMAVALTAMTGTLTGAAALLVAAKALEKLVPVILGLAAIPFDNILKSIAGLALAFGVLIVAGYMLQPLIIVFQGFGLAILAVGAGILALGIGITAAAAGITALSVSLAAGTASIIASIGMILAAIIEAIPFIVMMIGAGIIGILKTIGDAAETIVQVVVQIGLALINGLRQLFGPLATFLFEAMLFVIQFLTQNLTILIAALTEMTIQLIDGIALAIYENTDRLMAAIGHVLGAIINFVLAVVQEFVKQIPGVGGQISEEIGKVREDIAEEFSLESGKEIGKSLGDGVAEGTRSTSGDLYAAGTEAGESGKKGILDSFVGVPEGVQSILGGQLVGAVEGTSFDLNGVSLALGEGSAASIEEGFGDVEGLGAYLPEGVANGILNNQDVATDAGDSLMKFVTDAMAASAEIESPSKVTYEQGRYLDEGLANGITENQGLVDTAVAGLGSILTEGFNSVTSTFTNAGTRDGAAYAQGLTRGIGPARAASSAITRSATSALAAMVPSFNQNGTQSGNVYAAGVLGTAGRAKFVGSFVGSSAVSGLTTARPAFSVAGSTSAMNYAAGVQSRSGAARRAGNVIGTMAANGARNYGGFYNAGRDSGQGYLDGLWSRAHQIANDAAEIVRNALQAAKNAIESASPSKAYKRLGADSDEGYILGAKSKAGEMNSTMATIATNAMGAFYEGLSRANDAANDELTVTPTISPVMDMNNVYGGVEYLQDAFNNTGEILGNITADVTNNVADIRALVSNTKQILAALNNRRPITIDGKTVIGWVDVELGSVM